jgi:hypothetical protein
MQYFFLSIHCFLLKQDALNTSVIVTGVTINMNVVVTVWNTDFHYCVRIHKFGIRGSHGLSFTFVEETV